MQAQMQEMQTLMAAIKAEQDPAKLEALRQQHMELMHSGMKMMQMMTGLEHDSEETARPLHQHKR